jgi:hypothetical protein
MTNRENALRSIITRFWEDEAFKERLQADPAATLAAEGVEIPEGVTVNVVAATEDMRTLVIPQSPGLALSDEELGMITGSRDRVPRGLYESVPA